MIEELEKMGNEELANLIMKVLKKRSLKDIEDTITILIEMLRE